MGTDLTWRVGTDLTKAETDLTREGTGLIRVDIRVRTKAEIDLMRIGLTRAGTDLTRAGTDLTRAGTGTLTRMGTDSGYLTDNMMTETEMDHLTPT